MGYVKNKEEQNTQYQIVNKAKLEIEKELILRDEGIVFVGEEKTIKWTNEIVVNSLIYWLALVIIKTKLEF